MKFINYLSIILIAIASVIVSYYMGRNHSDKQHSKDYQAACIYSDICRNMIDSLGDEAGNIYKHYADSLFLYKVDLTKEELDQYYWCY